MNFETQHRTAWSAMSEKENHQSDLYKGYALWFGCSGIVWHITQKDNFWLINRPINKLDASQENLLNCSIPWGIAGGQHRAQKLVPHNASGLTSYLTLISHTCLTAHQHSYRQNKARGYKGGRTPTVEDCSVQKLALQLESQTLFQRKSELLQLQSYVIYLIPWAA